MRLTELEVAAGLDPDSPEYEVRYTNAQADDQLLERLVAQRQNLLTEAEMAERMRVGVQWVKSFEALEADPQLSEVRRYAAALGVTISHTVEQVVLSDADALIRAMVLAINAATDEEVERAAESAIELAEGMEPEEVVRCCAAASLLVSKNADSKQDGDSDAVHGAH